jgi:AMP deaminase
MVTNPSTTNPIEAPFMQFPNLPTSAMPLHPYPSKAGRMNPLNSSFSAGDIPALAQGSQRPITPTSSRPVRSSSMVFSPGGGPQSQPPPQPPTASSSSYQPPLSSPQHSMHRSDSIVNMDGSEPRIFPGVMSRHRRSSMQRTRSGSHSEIDGLGMGWARRSEADAAPEAVIEEPEDSSITLKPRDGRSVS